MYYLHRNGETTGPFAPGRLAQMLDAGEIDGDDQVCLHGTEEWMPAECVVPAPVEATPPSAPPLAKRVKRRPFVALSWLLALAGVGFLLFFPWIIGAPLGVLLVLAAIAIDRPRYLCGGCGNRIEKTSAICPACRARFR